MQYFAYAVPDEHGEIGVSPVALGEVFDTFEYEGAEQKDLLRLVEERNGPLRVEGFGLGRWAPYPQRFDATTHGYREARFLVATLREQGTGPFRIVTSSGAVVAHTTRTSSIPPSRTRPGR